MEAGVPTCDLGFFYQAVVFLRKHLLEYGPSLVCRPLFAPLLKRQGLHPCLVEGMIFRLDYLCQGERRLSVLRELDRVFCLLEVYIDQAVYLYGLYLYGLYQGLTAGL